jgi:hypothetical protein
MFRSLICRQRPQCGRRPSAYRPRFGGLGPTAPGCRDSAAGASTTARAAPSRHHAARRQPAGAAEQAVGGADIGFYVEQRAFSVLRRRPLRIRACGFLWPRPLIPIDNSLTIARCGSAASSTRTMAFPGACYAARALCRQPRGPRCHRWLVSFASASKSKPPLRHIRRTVSWLSSLGLAAPATTSTTG